LPAVSALLVDQKAHTMSQQPREEAIFLAALESRTASERAAFVEAACTGDEHLRSRVNELLAAHDNAKGPLDVTRVDPLMRAKVADLAEGSGMQIGPYKLLQQIGEGGMGVVFMAEQQHPVERRVALKIIKPGMDSRQVIARFEAERQALALMEHPNIAKVLDAGATDSGRPYFVMELVRGVPITQFCDDHQFTPRQRLELLVPVCQAVQHAHQKGIIHRDIKPTNILVAEYDHQPVPKIIDFGVAKAVAQRLTEKTMFTEFGQIVGTIEYMSPEQAKLNQLDIDTRTDIYSLGVLLYELLTGQTPFDRDRLRSAAFDEVLRIIREEEPPKPSTKLSSSQSLPSIAACRQTEPRQLTHQVKGELDWIVMKALEKDRNRRYETASGLAMDLQRFLNDEPVQACPPSRGYRLQKLLKRHRRAVLAVALILALLIAGIVGTTAGLMRAIDAEARARSLAADERQARQEEAKQRKQAEAAEARARTLAADESKAREEEARARQEEMAQRKQAEAVVDLLESIFHDLDPRRAQRDGVDLKTQLLERLDQAAEHLDDRYVGQPITRARLRKALAAALEGTGSPAKAVALLEKAREEYETGLGPDHHDTLSVRHRLGSAYQSVGRFDDAIRFCEETLKQCESKLGFDDPDVLNARNNLATAYRIAGRSADSIQLHEKVLKTREAKLGLDHPDTLSTRYNLGVALNDAGRTADAIRMHEETLRRCESRLGAEHHLSLLVRSSLAVAYRRAKRLPDAIRENEQLLKFRMARLGVDHPDTLTTRNNLAAAYKEQGRIADAIRLHEENLPLREARLGRDHPGTLVTVHNLAVAYEAAGQMDKALGLYQRSVDGSVARLGPDHPDTLSNMTDMATALARAGELDKSIALFESTLQAQTTRLGSTSPVTMRTLYNLAASYQKVRQYDKAEPLFQKAVAFARENPSGELFNLEQLLSNLGSNLLAQKKPAAAEPLFRECLEIHVRERPDQWPRYRAMSQVGASLLGQQRYAEAEPLLLDAYKGLDERASKIPASLRNSHLTSAARWLTELYDDWDKKEQAEPWREKWDAYRQGEKPKEPEPGDAKPGDAAGRDPPP
jgi:eukaryotic-like serine/threonine-protein kinase